MRHYRYVFPRLWGCCIAISLSLIKEVKLLVLIFKRADAGGNFWGQDIKIDICYILFVTFLLSAVL